MFKLKINKKKKCRQEEDVSWYGGEKYGWWKYPRKVIHVWTIFQTNKDKAHGSTLVP